MAGVVTGSPRFSILSVIILLAAGFLFLIRVDEAKGTEAAEALEKL